MYISFCGVTQFYKAGEKGICLLDMLCLLHLQSDADLGSLVL